MSKYNINLFNSQVFTTIYFTGFFHKIFIRKTGFPLVPPKQRAVGILPQLPTDNIG